MTSLYYNNLSSITNMIAIKNKELFNISIKDYDDYTIEYIISECDNENNECTLIEKVDWTKDSGLIKSWQKNIQPKELYNELLEKEIIHSYLTIGDELEDYLDAN